MHVLCARKLQLRLERRRITGIRDDEAENDFDIALLCYCPKHQVSPSLTLLLLVSVC
jgi:hypothetical protein